MKIILFAFCFLQTIGAYAQLMDNKKIFTRKDTLRGSLNANRSWWNVVHYDLAVKPDFNSKTLIGSNTITAKMVQKPSGILQIDLQQPLILDSVIINQETCSFVQDGNAWMVKTTIGFSNLSKDSLFTISIFYHGKPTEAIRPPWDGGLIWKKDRKGNPWIAVACQGLGASVWYPCKDHQSDEPDSMRISVTTPDSLTNVSNGRLRNKINNGNGTTTWVHAVVNPINNYNISMNIGKYAHFSDTMMGEKGIIDLDFYPLAHNEEKARKHFTQAKQMMKAFEYWFGPYPFKEDGYKLVETPYLGMEHQSATAYGNGYINGYAGQDLSGTGWGLKWDFMIVHESGHDWWGNNITTNDIADMWVHEGFTNFSEVLFTHYWYGKAAGNEYAIGLRSNIENDKPVIGPYGVNEEGSGDMYPKGANMLQTIRTIMNDDEKFRQMLRGMQSKWWHQTVNSADVEQYIAQFSGIPQLNLVFDQYLRTNKVPTLEYYISGSGKKKLLNVRFANVVKGFKLPITLPTSTQKQKTVSISEAWAKLPTSLNANEDNSNYFNKNYYINYERVR
jgi:aminopeptidase N